MRSRIKELLLAFLHMTGLLLVAVHLRLHGRATVLMYHRVVPADRAAKSCSAASIVVSPETFDWQMKLVRKMLRPVTGQEFVRLLGSGNRIPSRTCLVTFDDGWYDNLEWALPILEKHRVPAVLFVATDYIGTQKCFWQERLVRLLATARDNREASTILEQVGMSRFRDMPAHDAETRIRDLVERIKLWPRDQIESLVQSLTSLEPSIPENDVDRLLTWDGVRNLEASGLVEIGSHAASHTPLTLLSPADVQTELTGSRAVIRENLGKTPMLVAYPNGNANETIGTQARSAGYSAGFTTVRGLISTHCNPYLLPRVNIHEGATRSRGGFLARVTGLI